MTPLSNNSADLTESVLPKSLSTPTSPWIYLSPNLLPILAYVLVVAILTSNLDTFPLYFFCDEAIHGVEARSLLVNGRDSSGARWPLFFEGYGTFHISLSVYLHMLIQSILPLSEFSVRLVGV